MSEFVFYEEDGSFKAGSVLSDIGTSLQVEAASGKRTKIKASSVLLRYDAPGLADFAQRSQALADDIDPDFLWQVCGDDEFGFDALALDYFGHRPSAVEAAAVAIKLHASPMYFYKKGKGRYKAAPEESLKAALASVEKKQRQAQQIAEWVGALKSGVCPEALLSHLNMLLYKPDRNTLEVKALEQAALETGLSAAKLFAKSGALTSHHDYHLGKFLAEYFPAGREIEVPAPSGETLQWPLADVRSFSIDDAGTTEIDDAFSVVKLVEGGWRVGVHIAAPSLLFAVDSELDALAGKRFSTVYFPGDKITMLPAAAIATSTLEAGHTPVVVSMYLTVAPDLAVLNTHSVIERVAVAANLRIDDLAERFHEAALQAGNIEGEFGAELWVLWQFATELKRLRGERADDMAGKVDYGFDVVGERIEITSRKRGNPIDLTVSELMIFVNSSWGKLLAENGVAAIYRSQSNGRTRMSLDALPHEGLGVAQYAWSSSPLRRYVDLCNQRQLVSLLTQSAPRWAKRSPELLDIARRFELTYDAYAEFQRGMERYWVLRYFAQEGLTRFEANVLREDLVRATGLPFVTRVPGMPAQPNGAKVWIEVLDIDFWDASATFRFAGAVENVNDNVVEST